MGVDKFNHEDRSFRSSLGAGTCHYRKCCVEGRHGYESNK